MDYVNSPIPNSATYLNAANAAKTAYQNALAKISNNRSNMLRTYGYNGTFDDSGNVKTLAVDSGNPYGLYQQQRYSHASDLDAAKQAALDRGIAGGLANQQRTSLRYGFGADNANLGQGLTSGLSDFVSQQGDAYSAYQNALIQAQYQALQEAIASGAYNTADVSAESSYVEPDMSDLNKYLSDPANQYLYTPTNTKQKVAKQVAKSYPNYSKRG